MPACGCPPILGSITRSSRPNTPRPAARSSSRCNRSVVASASSSARWLGRWSSRKRLASVPSLQSGTSSRTRRRARGRVSMTVLRSAGRSLRSKAALIKPMSKPTLCPTMTASPMNSWSVGSTVSTRGALATIECVIPVRTVTLGAIALPGFISVAIVPRHSPRRTLTTPISVIMSPPRSLPVVSMSSTQNVTSASGVPRSSKERCTGRKLTTNTRSLSRTGVRPWLVAGGR